MLKVKTDSDGEEFLETELHEFATALDTLFDAIEKACKEAGLDIRMEYEVAEPGQGSMAMWLEDSTLTMYGGEIDFTSREQYNRFIRWAQIEGASCVGQLAEGLASDDILLREKAQRKKKELGG